MIAMEKRKSVVAAHRVVAGALGLALLVGCGSKSDSAADPVETSAVASTLAAPAVSTTIAAGEKLTTGQAFALSRVLVNNLRDGGADARVTVNFGSAASFELNGEVDWKLHRGTMKMSTKRTDGVEEPVRPLYWSGNTLLQTVPGLEEAMEKEGRAGVTLAARPLDARTAALDQTILVIQKLASEAAENPILLRQGDTGFLGSINVDGVSYDQIRYGKSVYVIDTKGTLRRMVATFKSINGPVVFDFTNRGPRTIELPNPSKVVDIATIPEVYKELTDSLRSPVTTVP